MLADLLKPPPRRKAFIFRKAIIEYVTVSNEHMSRQQASASEKSIEIQKSNHRKCNGVKWAYEQTTSIRFGEKQ
jgi:hypothetical protein